MSVVNCGFLVFVFVLFGGFFVFEFMGKVIFFFLRVNFICVCLIMFFCFLLELGFFVEFVVILLFIFVIVLGFMFLCVIIFEVLFIIEVLNEGIELFVMKGLKLLVEFIEFC